MKNKQDINKKINELTRVVKSRQKEWKENEQKLALKLALKIISGSRVASDLKEQGNYVEAFTVFRLTLEHLFNLGAVFSKVQHHDNMFNHAIGECSRQISWISEENAQDSVLSPVNSKRVQDFLEHPGRDNDPKNGLNYEQISRAGGLHSLYGLYRRYSFFFTHSTFRSVCVDPQKGELAELQENIWTVLQFTYLFFTQKTVPIRASLE